MKPFGKLKYRLFEKPLDCYAVDGGLVGIFRHIGCIGDSLSSGELEGTNENGERSYHDMYDFSWGQYLARIAGTKVSNFSKGGMSAHEYYDSFAEKMGYWEAAKDCDAFIIALGVNDVHQANLGKYPFGTLDDLENPGETALGKYKMIVDKLREIKPDAFIFFVTMASDYHNDLHREFLIKLTEKTPRAYLIDLYKYAPKYDKKFYESFFLGSHMSVIGYHETARMIASYIDYIIRHNVRDFRQSGFIGTGIANTMDPDGAFPGDAQKAQTEKAKN